MILEIILRMHPSMCRGMHQGRHRGQMARMAQMALLVRVNTRVSINSRTSIRVKIEIAIRARIKIKIGIEKARAARARRLSSILMTETSRSLGILGSSSYTDRTREVIGPNTEHVEQHIRVMREGCAGFHGVVKSMDTKVLFQTSNVL